jgi:hypothetical protein
MHGRTPLFLKAIIFAILMTGLCLASCSRKGPKNTFLVIAIDGLEPEDIRCRERLLEKNENKRSGFSVLCQEFLSLQGVIAPSTSVVSNLGSFLTGQEPNDTHLQTDDDVLSSKANTWPERIQSKGWRTAFFNSSPPISRKTNLIQGFGFSDENLSGQPKNYFRPLDQTLQVLLHWLNENNGPLAAVITSSDLRFPDIETQSDTGEIRRRSVESQIEEIDESLFNFFENLKKNPTRWEQLEIVVFSLEGRQRKRTSLPYDLDLVPNKLLLPTFIKTDGPSNTDQKSISGNWSLADLGKYVAWRLDELENRGLKENELIDFFERHKQDFVTSTGCIQMSRDRKVCRKAFFDEITWLAWDEGVTTETRGRMDLMARLLNSPNVLQTPKFSSKLVKNYDRQMNPGLGVFAECVKDFRNLKATQPYHRICGSSFLQMLRKWFLVSKAKVENFSEMKEIRGSLIKEWADFKAARELWDRLRAQERSLELNKTVISEILAAEEILNANDLIDIRRELDRGY